MPNDSEQKGKVVFAKWMLATLPEDFFDFYISCGAGERQYDGYFLHDVGAKITIQNTQLLYLIELEVPTQGLEKEKDYWLSPACINDEHEAVDWGVR